MARASVLIVDDEKNILSTLSRALRVEDYDVDVAGNGELAAKRLGAKAYDVLLLDVQLPDTDGLTILRQLREQGNAVPVVMMSGHGTIETAVQATQLGAFTFLEKPVGTEQLLLTLRNALGMAQLEAENRDLRERSGATDDLLGDSRVMVELRERIADEMPEQAQVETARALEAPRARRRVAQALVQSSSTLSITVALAPIPFSDLAVIAPLQGIGVRHPSRPLNSGQNSLP